MQHVEPVAVNETAEASELSGFACPIATLDPAGLRVHAFKSAWGREATPQALSPEGGEVVIGSTSGRSANGYMPLAVLIEQSGRAMVIAVCWSGNWQLRIAPDGAVTYGMTPDMLTCTLAPGETLPLPGVLTARGNTPEEALHALMAYLQASWFPQSRLPGPMVEWNHWWRFEDAEIDEAVFLANARQAQALGFTQCTLDAGWFGDAASPVHWTQCRGDWDKVNTARFPHGIRYLADQVHAMGMRFGLWIEPEAMGERSALRQAHPEWEATRDGKPLEQPYLCLGNPGAAAHLAEALDRLVTHTGCDFLKIDFNVDPGYGCNRADHGHQPGMGLYAHLHALYGILDTLREKHPALVIENCSSGGLRCDLEMLRHTDMAFLSDPDETIHALGVLWGSSLMMPPSRMLHWSHSQTRQAAGGGRPFPALEYGGLPEETLRMTLRAAMLHPFGMSRDLRTLGTREEEILAEEIARYKQVIAPLLGGTLYRLTGPFLREGERAADDGRIPAPGFAAEEEARCAFQLQLGSSGMVFVFTRKDTPAETLPLQGLDAETLYRIEDMDTGHAAYAPGMDLMTHGLALEAMAPLRSRMIRIQTADIPTSTNA